MDQPEIELPPVEAPVSAQKSDTSEPLKQLGAEKNPEFTSQDDGGASQQQLPPTPPPQQDDNSSQDGQTSSDGGTSTQAAGSTVQTPEIADDIDLIEKEWVEKAKEIVEKTKDNPYLQNKAISEIKSDYIKKRYNKDLVKDKG